ncbi:relaxase (plasmid) [Fusobacterium hwasookii ChDC F174]|uniref:Relaxase n=2 Tax=Fusobacterium TaxID=848 RepID=A0A0S2ZQJ0_9FUSO|nr:relaxase/mobilization nuclease domain-containing protein [Fusobacterium hwasookii]ALQ41250.1 relaxase [Fusobacterium hwasookii ChDC F174]
MQLIMKIAEEKRMNSKGMKALFNYIARESGVYKTIGIGMSDDSEKAFKQVMNNKRRFNKAQDDKMRFCYHEIISFEYGTDPELALKIGEDYCNKLHQEKGFNCYMGVHIDKQNTHIHILVDSVNYRTGKMLQSLTEKQLEKAPERRNLEEVYIYEEQRRIAEDMAIKNGYEIEDSKRYEAMHEAKKSDKNARKWLTKNQYKVFKQDEEKSWRNDIASKVKEMYKRLDLTEENVNQIASEYGLTITRHNKEKQTITFAIAENGEATKNRIKLEKLYDQEKGNFNIETNPFAYNNFFRDRSKEIENNREFEDFVKEIEAEEIAKELEKVMKEKEKSIREVANSLIKSKENQYNRELEREREVKKLLESNHKDYKQGINKIVNLEQDFKDKQAEIPNLEINVKEYNKSKSSLEENLPGKEIKVTQKTDIADEKAKEVARLKALLEQAERDFNIANDEKEQALEDLENTRDRIESFDNLIKSTEKKIIDNKEKIISIPKQVAELKDELEEKKNVIASNQEELKKVSDNVKIREQEYKEIKDTGMEKVLEYESIMRDLFNKQLEAEEQHKQEVADRYQKEIEEYQNNLKRQNAEWDKINELNRNIREQVRLEREQKALAKKKELQEQRAREEYQRKLEFDLQEFIKLIDKGEIENNDLIEMVDDLEECKNWKDSHKLQYGRNIKFYLSDLENTINVKSFFRETDEINKIIIENERLFKRISKYMENVKEEKAIPISNTKGVDKTVKEVEKVKKEEKEFE